MTEKVTTIRLRDDGPLVIDGPLRLMDAEGKEFQLPHDKPLIALCRCGASRTKPFCDGSHRQIGFACQQRAIE